MKMLYDEFVDCEFVYEKKEKKEQSELFDDDQLRLIACKLAETLLPEYRKRQAYFQFASTLNAEKLEDVLEKARKYVDTDNVLRNVENANKMEEARWEVEKMFPALLEVDPVAAAIAKTVGGAGSGRIYRDERWAGEIAAQKVLEGMMSIPSVIYYATPIPAQTEWCEKKVRENCIAVILQFAEIERKKKGLKKVLDQIPASKRSEKEEELLEILTKN